MNASSITSNGEPISYDLKRPDSGATDRVVVMLHGGPGGDKNGPANLFVNLADKLADADFSSLRFSFRGSGESGGNAVDTTLTSQLEDFCSVLSWVRERKFERIAVVGESLGATMAVLGYDPSFAAMVLLWPAIWLMDTDLTDYLTPDRRAEFEKSGYIDDGGVLIGRRFMEECEQADLEEKLESILCPTLFMHGDSDTSVSHEQSIKAHSMLKTSKKLVIVEGGGHGLKRPEESEKVQSTVVDWLVQSFK